MLTSDISRTQNRDAPRTVTGTTFTPVFGIVGRDDGGPPPHSTADPLEAVAEELSAQLASLMEDNAKLFEGVTQARNLPALLGAYHAYFTKRMTRTAALQTAIWKAWVRTIQSASTPSLDR